MISVASLAVSRTLSLMYSLIGELFLTGTTGGAEVLC